MKNTVILSELLFFPALCTTLLNAPVQKIPFALELTLGIVGLCIITISYRYSSVFYRHNVVTVGKIAALYTGLVASVIIFCSAQAIRLIGGILYAATYIFDKNAFAYQMHYVLPNFFGGIMTSFTTIVSISFIFGFGIVMPLILFRMRVRGN